MKPDTTRHENSLLFFVLLDAFGSKPSTFLGEWKVHQVHTGLATSQPLAIAPHRIRAARTPIAGGCRNTCRGEGHGHSLVCCFFLEGNEGGWCVSWNACMMFSSYYIICP